MARKQKDNDAIEVTADEQPPFELSNDTPEKQVADAQLEAAADVVDVTLNTVEEKAEAHKQVLVQVQHAYTLRIDNHSVIDMPAGVYKVDRYIADHWYSVANKIQILG